MTRTARKTPRGTAANYAPVRTQPVSDEDHVRAVAVRLAPTGRDYYGAVEYLLRLQGRYSRSSRCGLRDVDDPLAALAETVDAAGGVWLAQAGQARTAYGRRQMLNHTAKERWRADLEAGLLSADTLFTAPYGTGGDILEELAAVGLAALPNINGPYLLVQTGTVAHTVASGLLAALGDGADVDQAVELVMDAIEAATA